MSSPLQRSFKSDNKDDDSPSDFFNVPSNSRSLHRPTDHYNYSYMPPPLRKGHLASRFLKDPLNTALSQVFKVTNFVLNPLEENSPEDHDTLGFDLLTSDGKSSIESEGQFHEEAVVIPPPALPSIECSNPQKRLPPLTSEDLELLSIEFDKKKLCERIFKGGIADNSLRQKLWPIIIGLADNLEPIDWTDMERLYSLHHYQWESILPSQEERFTTYRERKSIAERDVVRCDRHLPFYHESTGNISKLRELLMTYIMYDFDTGYVQGMSDLAVPLLYIWSGDVVKSFWCFVQVMKLYRRNFELSQNSVKTQLRTLMKLIELTDPLFAQYLSANESGNCYFAFRWIICIFKREFMKSKTDDYNDCLIVWETIWALHALTEMKEKDQENTKQEVSLDKKISDDYVNDEDDKEQEDINDTKDEYDDDYEEYDPTLDSLKSESKPYIKLQTVELFSLCICLAIIRAERDVILASKFDGSEILKHFNTVHINDCLNTILTNATNIWYWLKYDGGEKLLYAEDKLNKSDDDYDFLTDQEYLFQNVLN